MLNDKKIFTGGINADDDLKMLQPDQFLNAENIRMASNWDGKGLRFEGVPSPILTYYYYPIGDNFCIGSAVDYSRQRLIWFNKNSNGEDGIYCYDLNAETTYLVLLSGQTELGLNFSKTFRIDRNAKVVGDLLIWTDNTNEPMCINIEAGIKLNQPSYTTDRDAYVAPIPYTSLTLIKKPPIFELQVEKIVDGGFDNNFIALNAYQFTYRYWYKDYQYSVLANYSQLIPYNNIDDTYNGINVKMPFGEDIPDEVQQVDFCVKYGNEGETFIIKSYNKDNYYDAVAISDHNIDSTQLGFTFYDNTVGIPLDDITAALSFDLVALLVKSLDIARNRLFLANVLKGYDTPSTTSLDISLGEYDTGGAGTYSAEWKYFYLTYRNTTTGVTGTIQYYYAYVSTIIPSSFFYSTYEFATSPPSSLNSADATSSWATEVQLAAWAQRNLTPPVGTVWTGAPYNFYVTGGTLNIIFEVDLSGLQFFKSSSTYKVSITFFDRFRRKCGVVQRAVEIEIPDRTYDQTVFATNIIWTLNNSNALNEIPDWAYYYQIAINKNLTTRFFVQIYVNDTAYVVKNQDGTYNYSGTTFSINTYYAVGFDLTALTSNGLGYTFNEGDLVRAYKTDGTNVILTVLGTDGNYILCSPEDLGTLGTQDYFIEIYTPYRPSVTEPFFETGTVMSINNPGTSSREYSILSDTINGDCYAIERDKGSSNLYFVEAMSPNDKKWQDWQMDRGWTNFIDTIGQQRKETNIDWSDTYINGTKINGLNKFGALNTKDIGNSSGDIYKIILANKMEEAGTVMLVVTETQTLSAYLGEVQLYKAASADAVITTDQVIGTINPLKYNFGTIHPESICEKNGTVFGWDAINGVVWQYDANGLVPVSYFNMRSFWDRVGKRTIEQGTAVLEAYCGFYTFIGCIDPSTGEYLITIPQLEANTVSSGIPVGFAPELPSYDSLPDYASSIQNRFEIYDGQAKTMIYKYENNKWYGAYQFLPDWMEYVGNKLFSFKEGELYLHNENSASFNNFYGTQYPQRICFVSNSAMPSIIKDLFGTAVEGNNAPSYAVIYTDYPNEQITDLAEDDFENKEGIQYAVWMRDRLSPNVTGSAVKKMYEGDYMKTATPLVMLEFSVYNSQLIINFVNISYEISEGHNSILKTKT